MYRCAKCEWITDSNYEMSYSRRANHYICHQCKDEKRMNEVEEDLILPTFKKSKRRAAGFELEACFANSEKWKDPGYRYVQRMYDDSSINPDDEADESAEICTQPISDLRRLKVVLGAVERAGGYVNSSCGGHIHIDARDIRDLCESGDDEDLLAITHLWREVQAGFIALCSPTRVKDNIYPFGNGQYCLANTINPDLDFFNRYKALNVSSLEKGTLEFRLWDASLDFETLAMRANLGRAFVSYAAEQMRTKGTFNINKEHKGKKYWVTSRKTVPTIEKFCSMIKTSGAADIQDMATILKVHPLDEAKLLAFHEKLWHK